MRCSPIFLALGALFAGSACAIATGMDATVSTNASSFKWKRFTANDELPQTRVACLKQTREGYLWIGTWSGLARFDGRKFKTFNKENNAAFQRDEITALTEDTEGALWIGTADGLVSYRNQRFQRFSTLEGLPENGIRKLERSSDGGLWLQTDQFLVRMRDGKISEQRKLPEGSFVFSIREGPGQRLHILTQNAWLTWTPFRSEMRTNWLRGPAEPQWFSGEFAQDGGKAWIGCEFGLFEIRDGVVQEGCPLEMDQAMPAVAYRDRAGKVWFSPKSGGLWRGDKSEWELIAKPANNGPGAEESPGVVGGSLVCMEQDKDGDIWLGTTEGLIQMHPMRVKAFSMRDGLARNHVFSVCEADDGAIWVGTLAGLNCIRSNQVVPLANCAASLATENRCVWPRAGEGVWVGLNGAGLFEYRDGHLRERKRMPGDMLNSVYGDKKGRVWVTGSRGTWFLKDDEGANVGAGLPGGAGNSIHSVLEDKQGVVWFGTKGHGLVKWDEGKASIFSEPAGIGRAGIWSIHEDVEGILWLGTESGLVRFEKGRGFTFNRQNGLVENGINCVLEDGRGGSG